MKICIDDGSTNIKLAWTENGERRNAISPNSFKSEWSAPFGGTQPANYMLDGVRYGFDPVSDRFVQTTDTQYQYSDVNVIAIHHALVKSGITPQEVDVVVTLPLSEYFDTNAQPDMTNINRKKANVMRPVEYQNGEAFTIRNVRVMPESIPAGFKALADMSPFESLLIVDLGGTTLDVAKVQGQLAGISQVFCDPHVGVSLMADAVLSVMATNGMRTSHHIANTIIEHRHDEAWLRQHIHNDAHYDSLIDLNTLWSPDTCPAHLLPYLAWAFSVDRWDRNWPEETKRQVIRDAWLIHRHKGTISALRRAIEPLGYLIRVSEWWEFGGEPGTFTVEVGTLDSGVTEEMYLEMERLIADARPVSRHMTGLNIIQEIPGDIFAAAATYDGEVITIYPDD
ncbi:phage tail protein I [Escherichia coli]|nr:phage tail protein I [Escherichia coli]